MTWLLEHWAELSTAITLLLGAATIITGLTETPKDDEVLKKIAKFLSFVTNKDANGTFKLPFKP